MKNSCAANSICFDGQPPRRVFLTPLFHITSEFFSAISQARFWAA